MAGFKPYFRPNQKWVCGWSSIGKPCPRGPGEKGKCKPQTECEPLKVDGGYKCSRAPQFGGKCNLGPSPEGKCSHIIPPCSPRRSIRAQRGLLVLCVSAVSLGLVFMQLGRKQLNAGFISPGGLSSQHRSVEHDCTVCHQDMGANLASIISGSSHPRATADQCLNCHKMDENAFFAHSMNPEEMAKITSAHGGVPSVNPEKMQCMTCHKEHRGMDADLTALTNQNCQTCHTVQFHGFEEGHSEFSASYPFNRRTRILFDHASHFATHFPEAGKENISCQNCHQPDSFGENMVPSGFDRSCATCHGAEIQGIDQSTKGIVFFRLPGLDLGTLAQKKSRIGVWPEDADGELTAFQRAFLASSAKTKAAYELVSEMDLTDLSDASAEEIKAVETVIWGLKQLLHDMGSGDGSGFRLQLMRIAGKPLSNDVIAKARSGINAEVFRMAGNTWLRGLGKEVEGYSSGTPAALRNISSPENASDAGDENRQIYGGWYRMSEDFTIRYRPQGHGDAFLQSWLDISATRYGQTDFAKKLFEQIGSRSESPGYCLKCHTVDAKANGSMQVNWQGARPESLAKSFTKFSHVSHFALLSDEGCYRCHQLNTEASYDAAYEGFDPAKYVSNFHPIKKSTCVECHSNDRVGTDCQSCHQYHVGAFSNMGAGLEGVETKLLQPEGEEVEPSESESSESPEESSKEDVESEADETEAAEDSSDEKD